MSVYFICVGRYVKVGFSDDPDRRFQNLHKSGTRYTFPVDASIKVEDRQLYRVVDGWKDAEEYIHIALDNYAVGLEWFLAEAPVFEFIDALPSFPSDRLIRSLPAVPREGGFCRDEYERVQHGRAERETARYMARRSA